MAKKHTRIWPLAFVSIQYPAICKKLYKYIGFTGLTELDYTRPEQTMEYGKRQVCTDYTYNTDPVGLYEPILDYTGLFRIFDTVQYWVIQDQISP